MPIKVKRKRGAPKGNQNARKHGFYSKVLDEAEQFDFELASGVNGIDDEIALLRVKIKSILEKDPENIKLIMQATNTLAGLVKTSQKSQYLFPLFMYTNYAIHLLHLCSSGATSMG